MAPSAKPNDDPDAFEPASAPGAGRPRPQGPRQDQRERLLAAVALVLAAEGYAALTAAKVAQAAGVSPQAFHASFADKREAVEAAHEGVFERFRERLLGACAGQAQWPFKVKVAIAAALDFAAAAPDQARLLVLGPLDPELAVARRALEARDNLAALLASGRAHVDGSSQLPSLTEQALIAGLAGAISARLVDGEAKRLPELAPQLVQFTLLPYLGRAEAARVARWPRPSLEGL